MADHHAYLNLMMQLTDAHGGFDIVHNHSLHHLPVVMAPHAVHPHDHHAAYATDAVAGICA